MRQVKKTKRIVLGSSVSSIAFKFYDGGGNLNLEINGQMRNFYQFADVNDFTLGGTLISVVSGTLVAPKNFFSPFHILT